MSALILLRRKLSLSSCDEWLSQSLPYLVFRSLSGVLLQLVLRWRLVQQFFKICPQCLQLVFITGTYIAILIFDGSVCVLVFPANVLVIS